MNNQTTTTNVTPAIEGLKVHTATIRLYVDVTLASIPFTMTGQYNIDTNCFYPSTLMPVMDIVDGEKVILATGISHDLEDVCNALGWDQYETHDQLQVAVEKRG